MTVNNNSWKDVHIHAANMHSNILGRRVGGKRMCGKERGMFVVGESMSKGEDSRERKDIWKQEISLRKGCLENYEH
jgi:hypothetical protein